MIDLNRELREFDLLMNHKKTEIAELPIAVVESWIHKIQNRTSLFQKHKDYVDYKEIQAYIDYTVKLVTENNENHSILFYAIKSLNDFTLTPNAKRYLVKSVVSLALLYPYLIPILKEYLFKPFSVTDIEMGEYANLIYDRYINSNNYEACSFAILYAIDANCELTNFNIQKIMESKDCILLLMAYLYCKKRSWRGGVDKLKKHAKQIVKDNELDQYWIFVYEILGSGSLKDDWASMKKSKVSFLKAEYK